MDAQDKELIGFHKFLIKKTYLNTTFYILLVPLH